jgi:hypothetical protein
MLPPSSGSIFKTFRGALDEGLRQREIRLLWVFDKEVAKRTDGLLGLLTLTQKKSAEHNTYPTYPTSGRVTRLVPFLNVIERVSVADRPVPRVLRLIG